MNLTKYFWKSLESDGLRDTLRHYRGSPFGSPNRRQSMVIMKLLTFSKHTGLKSKERQVA